MTAKERDECLILLTRLCHAADRLLACLHEFCPEYTYACSEWAEALDALLAEAEKAGLCERKGAP